VRSGSKSRCCTASTPPELTEALRAYGDTDDELSELWRALDDDQSRLDKLEDDYYVNGVLTDERRFTRLHTQLEAKLANTRKTLDRATARTRSTPLR
jgi:hypothetical protein